jgi:hypothetical protein
MSRTPSGAIIVIDGRIDPDARIQACGKEVLMDGAHLADCADDKVALIVAICLNRIGSERMTDQEKSIVEGFFV